MTNADIAWEMPSLDRVYHVEGQGPMPLRSLLEGLAPELIPTNQASFDELLCSLGAWESVDEMRAALATCEGMRDDLRVR